MLGCACQIDTTVNEERHIQGMEVRGGGSDNAPKDPPSLLYSQLTYMFVRTLYEPLKNHKCYQWTFKEPSLNYLFSLAGLLGVRLPIVLEGHGWMSKFTLCGQCIASCQTPHWCHGELLTLRWLTALVGHCWLSDSSLYYLVCIVNCEIAHCTGGALLAVRLPTGTMVHCWLWDCLLYWWSVVGSQTPQCTAWLSITDCQTPHCSIWWAIAGYQTPHCTIWWAIAGYQTPHWVLSGRYFWLSDSPHYW